MYDLDVNCKVIVKDILGEFPRHCDEPNDQIKLPIAQVNTWVSDDRVKLE